MKVSKIFRLLTLSVLITLAVVGVGILGGVPLPLPKRKENEAEIVVEQVESPEEDTTVANPFEKK